MGGEKKKGPPEKGKGKGRRFYSFDSLFLNFYNFSKGRKRRSARERKRTHAAIPSHSDRKKKKGKS